MSHDGYILNILRRRKADTDLVLFIGECGKRRCPMDKIITGNHISIVAKPVPTKDHLAVSPRRSPNQISLSTARKSLRCHNGNSVIIGGH